MNMKNNQNLIWIDLEMTGLNPLHDRIIELAIIITDANLNVLAESESFAINQSDIYLDGMDAWNTRQHNGSGLVARVRASKLHESEVEASMLAFLSPWLDARQSPMCGNSICQDRRFLCQTMPGLEAFFHYRNLDVSTLKELVKRWRPELLPGLKKQSKHLALDDIKDSIDELKYYREHFILNQSC